MIEIPGLARLREVDPSAAAELETLVRRLVRTADAATHVVQQAGAYAATRTPGEVLDRLVADVRALVPGCHVVALEWTGPVEEPRVEWIAGDSVGVVAELPTLNGVSTTMVGRAAASGRPVWREGASPSGPASLVGAEAAGCVPIGDLGVLFLSHPLPGAFPPTVRSQVVLLAQLAGGVIRSRRVVSAAPQAPPIPGLVGAGAAMRELHAGILAFAAVPWPVLVLGETGTGKEAVARALHTLSTRADAPFVAFNAGTVPPELTESTLFGHERGAFTGADRAKEGLCERVGAGTLFLDEVGELTPRAQVALLRLLQERRFVRVGGSEELVFRGRVVAATWRPLDDPARRGEVRTDLFHRIGACILRVPPLRERTEDVPALAAHLLARADAELGGGAPVGLPEATVACLVARDWPGNVRELENTLRVALARVRARGGSEVLPGDVGGPTPAGPTPPPSVSAEPPLPEALPLLALTEAYQRRVVRAALERARWNRNEAAAALGVSRQWLHRLLARWGGEP